MDDKQFEKRMELLKKSYDRMEPQLDPDTVFAQIEAENATQQAQEPLTVQKSPSKWQKSAVRIASIASVLLVGVLVSSYVIKPSTVVQTEEHEQRIEYDEWLSNLKEKYQEKLEQMQQELNIPEQEFEKFTSVQLVESGLNNLSKRKEMYIEISNNDYLKNLENNILEDLRTPREQIELIDTYADPMSFEESYYFFSRYSNLTEDIMQYYNNQLAPYDKILSQKPKNLPADLTTLIATAEKQYFELQNDGYRFSFRPNPVFGAEAPDYIDRLHPDVLGYFKYLATGSLLVAGDLRYPVEDSANILRQYEQTLLTDDSTERDNYNVLKGEFENTWLAILKGTDANPIQSKNGQLKSDYLELLTTIAKGKYGEALRETAHAILNEVELTGQSKTLEQLTTYDIWMGILRLRADTFMQTEDGSTSLAIDDNWIEQTKTLYNEYAKTKDDTIIDTLNPINIVSLFLYAHGIHDRETAQRLLSDDVDIDTVVQFDGMDNFMALYETGKSPIIIRVSVKKEAYSVLGRQMSFQLSTVVTGKGEQRCLITAINE